MTLWRYVLGVGLAAVVVLPFVAAAVAVRRRILPGWTGAEAVVVDLVLTMTGLTLLGEALGTVGWFSTVPLLVGGPVLGGVVWLAVRRPPTDDPAPGPVIDPSPRIGRRVLAVLGGGLVLVVGPWITRTITALDGGMTTVDTLWYHLPAAARFVQTGSTTSVQFLDSDPVTAYFPLTSSLWHAIAFELFGSDIASTVVNLGWLTTALLAAWCIGRPFGVSAATTLGAAIIFAAPGMVETQPGGALTDVAGLALLLAAVAILLHASASAGARPIGADASAALAAGLATGMKFTFLVPAGAICLGIVATSPRGIRLRRLAVVAGATFLSGGYWYVRNLLLVGNPLPSLDIGIEPWRLPSVQGGLPTATVASKLLDRGTWSEFFLPGLRDALGVGWPAVVLLSVAGMVASIVQRRDNRVRMLGIVAMASTAGFLLTPQYLFEGYFFATNLRYAHPGLLLGLVLVPIALGRWGTWVLGALAVTIVFTVAEPVSWSVGFGGQTFFAPAPRQAAIRGGLVALALAVAVVAVVFWSHRDRRIERHMHLALACIPPLILGTLGVAHGHYIDSRYADLPQWAEGTATDDHLPTIGVYGALLAAKYPLIGPRWDHRVQYLGVKTDDGGFRPARSCNEWVEALEEFGIDQAVLISADPTSGPVAWTATQPDAQRVSTPDAPGFSVFRLDGTRRHRSC